MTKVLARPLTNTLGTISEAHLKNSTDLIERLTNIDFTNRKMASFDVKALYTNVPVNGAIGAVSEAIQRMSDNDLPVPKSDFIKLVSLCINFGPFVFNEEEFEQHSGLAMGSPLSAVAACLYMETLEKEHFIRIIGRGNKWVRYVDDILVIVHKNVDLQNKLARLNRINDRIQFTIEEEENCEIPFLDTLIKRTGNTVKFRVYLKPTNKDDFIHYLSAHSDRIKSGVIIGFFLRALRTCSNEYLNEEIEYINKAFMNLGYPIGLLIKLKNKAVKIRERNETVERQDRKVANYITIPNSKEGEAVCKYLRNTDVNVVTTSGIKIKDLTGKKYKKCESGNESVIYKIPCSGCNKAYYGETSRGVTKRLYEHKLDVKRHRTSNAIVMHIDQSSHLPRWEGVEVIDKGMCKTARKAIEAAHILVEDSINSRGGFVTWSKPAAQVVLRERSTRVKSRVGSDQSGDRDSPRPVR